MTRVQIVKLDLGYPERRSDYRNHDETAVHRVTDREGLKLLHEQNQIQV